MKNFKRILALALASFCIFAIAGCAKEETSTTTANTEATAAAASSAAPVGKDQQFVLDKGKLVVGITNFAPMDYKDDKGEWIGFDADFARAFAKELGVDVEFIEIEWDTKFLELQSKTIDCIWNGMTITPEVLKNSSCTEPYAINNQVVVMKSDVINNYKDVKSLKDLSFAAEAGSAGAAYISDEKWNLNEVTAQSDALLEVKSGTVDACVIDSTMAKSMTGEGTDYADLAVGIELTNEEYGVSFRKDSDLTNVLNNFIKASMDNGFLKDLSDKYKVTLP